MTVATHYKCGACGWVHFELSLEDAQAHTDAVNATPLAGREPVTVERYFVCSRCGASSTTFVPAVPGDAPPLSNLRGVVMQSKVTWQLSRWRAYEVQLPGRKERTTHFAGHSLALRVSKVTPPIVAFDPDTNCGTAEDGEIYQLLGKSRFNLDVQWTWKNWVTKHLATDCVNVSVAGLIRPRED